MAALINTRLKSTTIIEVIIAFVIVLLSFAICMTVYTGSISARNSNVAFRALARVKEISARSKSEGNYIDEQVVSGDITYRKTVTPHPNSANLYLLKVEACSDKGVIIARTQEIIRIKK